MEREPSGDGVDDFPPLIKGHPVELRIVPDLPIEHELRTLDASLDDAYATACEGLDVASAFHEADPARVPIREVKEPSAIRALMLNAHSFLLRYEREFVLDASMDAFEEPDDLPGQ